MNRILRKDPIVEAVCEIRFAPNKWDWTVPGLVYQQLKDRGFSEKETQSQVDFQFDATPDGVVPSAQTSIGRMQFWRKDRTALVQIGLDHLAIHQLKPYTGWPHFKAMIKSVLTDYEAQIGSQTIAGISLRYINRLPLPPVPFRIQNVLDIYPHLPGSEDEEVVQLWGSWMQRVEVLRPELQAALLVQAGFIPHIADAPPSPDTAHRLMMLDLLFARAVMEPLPREVVSDWLETAHTEIETLFFDAIKPTYLQILEPEEVSNAT